MRCMFALTPTAHATPQSAFVAYAGGRSRTLRYEHTDYVEQHYA